MDALRDVREGTIFLAFFGQTNSSWMIFGKLRADKIIPSHHALLYSDAPDKPLSEAGHHLRVLRAQHELTLLLHHILLLNTHLSL